MQRRAQHSQDNENKAQQEGMNHSPDSLICGPAFSFTEPAGNHSRPLNNGGLNCMVHLYMLFSLFFSKYLYCLLSAVGSPWMQRAKCTHCPTPFQTGELITCRFWYPQRVLEPTPGDTKGQIKFWGSQKLCVDFQLRGASAPLTHPLFKVMVIPLLA